MGARPLHYLLTTALPADARARTWIAAFARGLGEDQQRFGVALLGGDSVATPGPAVLSLTAIGEVAAGAEIRRSGARPGDDRLGFRDDRRRLSRARRIARRLSAARRRASRAR